MNMTPYILEKDGVYYSFPSERAACEFLGVPICSVASCARRRWKCRGYNAIKAVSESEIYMDKRLHKIWESMHERCEYEKHVHYKNYGGRGISVCEEWSQYIPFAKWALRNGYSKNLTLDRIDVDGNYEPFNCRWVTVKEQMNNKRNNRIINVEGEEYTLSELADLVGIKKTTLRARLNSGWSSKDAISIPIRKRCGAKMGVKD